MVMSDYVRLSWETAFAKYILKISLKNCNGQRRVMLDELFFQHFRGSKTHAWTSHDFHDANRRALVSFVRSFVLSCFLLVFIRMELSRLRARDWVNTRRLSNFPSPHVRSSVAIFVVSFFIYLFPLFLPFFHFHFFPPCNSYIIVSEIEKNKNSVWQTNKKNEEEREKEDERAKFTFKRVLECQMAGSTLARYFQSISDFLLEKCKLHPSWLLSYFYLMISRCFRNR